MHPHPIQTPLLAHTPHGFFGREGGVSTGIHAGLNIGLGSDDDRDAILENRRRVVEAVTPGRSLVTVHQVHSPDCVVADIWADDARPHADAIVTDNPAYLIGILTADCVPVLFADAERNIVGAAHAGWKGALTGVTDRTIEAMEKLGAKRDAIVAAIGPCIARASYEVDDAFVRRFGEDDPANERFFAEGRRAGHAQFDIEAYVVHRLATAGLGRVMALGEDTYAQESRFFSFRRATHKGESGYGRQISVIGAAA
ncbi:peptidoglycan editing factor PgeF [Sphingomonas crocodyli]|uniref:Purine nucleoside phosphorylase n=1 Tax=Sphingomonas crocodyli TaxID=1979270 RepID=A0A437M1A6_9SPHN|nr:peptidoglycan editing factor PgeF [Sphingomonas crocodyli]RVT91304.1 peptidoglycan editing factor PgeF [Sphingomonas crocodyli]